MGAGKKKSGMRNWVRHCKWISKADFLEKSCEKVRILGSAKSGEGRRMARQNEITKGRYERKGRNVQTKQLWTQTRTRSTFGRKPDKTVGDSREPAPPCERRDFAVSWTDILWLGSVAFGASSPANTEREKESEREKNKL